MRISDIQQNMNMIRGMLSKYIQSDLVCCSEDHISWVGYRPGIFKNHYYPLEYQWLIDNQQYSFLLRNGALLQFYYSFDNHQLKSARAALYPRPISSNCPTDDLWSVIDSNVDNDLYQYLFNVIEEIEQTGVSPSNTSHIRFDYDNNVTTHEKSHIQFGGVNEIRIHANFFPTPCAFMELVIDALHGFEIDIKQAILTHSTNKTLRGLSTSRLINLFHI